MPEPNQKGPASKRGFLLLGFLTLTWGLGWPIMKVALGEMPPWSFRTLCLIGGGLAILALARAKGDSLRIPRGELGSLLLVAGVNVTGWNLLSAYGIVMMEAGRAAILAYTMPLWAALLGRFFLGERLTPARLCGLALGLCGLAVLMGPEIAALERAPLGSLFMLGAAFSWALGTVLIKGRAWSMPTPVFAGWQLLLGGLPVLAGTLVLEPLFWGLDLSARGSLAVAYVVVVGVVLGYWGWLKVIQIFPVTVASLGTLAVPAIGVLSGGLLLGEPLGWRELAALGLVVLGLAGVMVTPGAADGDSS
jgi:drug/metabolite transporter (DMT)-like permease